MVAPTALNVTCCTSSAHGPRTRDMDVAAGDAQAAAPEVAPEATPVEVPVDAPATSPEATAAAAVPALRKDMPMAELKTYLNEFTSLSTGVKMFAHAKVGTEWFGNVTMATFFDLSSSRDRWQAVVDNLFAGDKFAQIVNLFQ